MPRTLSARHHRALPPMFPTPLHSDQFDEKLRTINPFKMKSQSDSGNDRRHNAARQSHVSINNNEIMFAPPFAPVGRRRALLVGCNYPGTWSQLNGCHEDIRRMHNMLVRHAGFAPGDIQVLIDDAGTRQPTRGAILSEATRLVAGTVPGDLLFFHFSGHGAQVEYRKAAEDDGLNEVILPCDWRSAGVVTDDDLNSAMVQPLQSGVRLVAVMDCCHAGTGLDLPYTCLAGPVAWREDVNPLHTRGDVVLFSGCEDHDTSAEDPAWHYGRPSGVMTTAFIDNVTSREHSYGSLLEGIEASVRRGGYHQRPQLSASQPFLLGRPFSLEAGIGVPNANPFYGRKIRRRIQPSRMLRNVPLANDLASAGLGLAVGSWFAAPMFMSAHGPPLDGPPLGMDGGTDTGDCVVS